MKLFFFACLAAPKPYNFDIFQRFKKIFAINGKTIAFIRYFTLKKI